MLLDVNMCELDPLDSYVETDMNIVRITSLYSQWILVQQMEFADAFQEPL